MKTESNRAGEYVSNLSGEMAYQSFKPSALPPTPPLTLSNKILQLASAASAKLGELNAASRLVVNADLFVSMYVRLEAVISSQIEGTQCTLEDILDPELENNKNLDVIDVVNYVKALSYATNRLQELPLCNRLLKETHAILLDNVRGKEKNPGEFRKSQNWIGPARCSLQNARFIPPNVEDMEQAMFQLESFINENTDYDPLVRAALIHYQFETIHPFLDGNGRIGRMLILLYFLEQKLLNQPILYVSYFLKRNQYEYYNRMAQVRETGDYEQWICFFLEAVKAASEDSIETIFKLLLIRARAEDRVKYVLKNNQKAMDLLKYLEEHPIIDIGHTAKDLGYSYNTISSLINKFIEMDILRETNNQRRNRTFVFHKYLAVLRKEP